jgi:hypothetical protein
MDEIETMDIIYQYVRLEYSVQIFRSPLGVSATALKDNNMRHTLLIATDGDIVSCTNRLFRG